MEKASKLIKYICALHRAWQFLQECSSPVRQDPRSRGSAEVQFVTLALCLPGSEKIKTSSENGTQVSRLFGLGIRGKMLRGLVLGNMVWVGCVKLWKEKLFFHILFFVCLFFSCYLLCYNQGLKCCNSTTVFSDFLEPFS